MYANTQEAATHYAFPDTCNTLVGTVTSPITYPNIAESDGAVPVVENVLINAMPAHNLLTIVLDSNGDEAGALGGVVSGMIMGQVMHEIGSVKVMLVCSPATTLTGVTAHNGTVPNTAGSTIVASQYKVMICG